MTFFKKLTYKRMTVNSVIVSLFVIFTSCGVKQLSSKVSNKSTPEVIKMPNNTSTVNPLIVNKMAAGDDFTCASGKISDNSQPHPVYCWGRNSSNQLATSAAANPQRVPMSIPELLTERPIFSLSSAFGCMLKAGEDTISCWGKNDQFQLGNAGQTTGNGGLAITNVDDPNSDVAVFSSATSFHSCFYTTSKSLQCLGQNWLGSFGNNTIGINTISSTFINISGYISPNLFVQNLISAHHDNYLLMNDGSVFCWGRNHIGQCGLGNTTTQTGLSQMVMPPGVVAKEVLGLSAASCILSQTNQVYCTGLNTTNGSGLLGDNTLISRSNLALASTLTGINVKSLPSHSSGSVTNCIITQSGGVKCWGQNLFGQVGNGNTISPQMLPQDVVDGSFNPITQVTSLVLKFHPTLNSFDTSVCALKLDGSVLCWGRGGNGQLGNNSTSNSSVAVNAQLPMPAKKIFAGIRSACALLTDDSLYCWGDNTNGKLGINSTVNSLIPRQVLGLQNKVQNIIGGVNHTCAHLVDGMLQCWGGNINGVLGMSDLSFNRYVPSTPFPFYGGTSKVSAVSTGTSHTCILILGGYPKCFGNNQSGQLGIGTNVSTAIPSYPRTLQTTVIQLALGENHSCFLGADRLVYCTGDNSFGQLGNGLTTSSSIPTLAILSNAISLASGKNHVCAILLDKSTWCWGNNTFGQLGLGRTSRIQMLPSRITAINETLTQVTAGRSHTCGLSSTNKVYCWGLNLSGQLGTGSFINSFVPKAVIGLENLKISEVIAGANHTCAKTTDNQMYCWGENDGGQLGNNTLTKSNIPLLVTLP